MSYRREWIISLQAKLDQHLAEFEQSAPPEIVEAIRKGIRAAVDSGYEERALKVGDKAPVFQLPDSAGTMVSSTELLAQGPLVVTFYRGAWCPFCNMELQSLQDFAGELADRGVNIVAVSPQNSTNSRSSARKNGVSFPILVDEDCAVADAFGLLYMPPDYVQEIYLANGIDLEKINAAANWKLPMPGRYLIDTDGTIRYAEVNPDYTRRPEAEELRGPITQCKAE